MAAAILAAALPADNTPARAYLASRGTWPPAGSGPDLPAVVFELARPGCAPDAVTAAGNRPAERWRRTVGNAAGRTFEVATPTGDPWPDADAAPLVVAIVEG